MADKKCSDSSCSKSSCSGCSKAKTDFSVAPHPDSSVKRVIGIVSGKGGVGKSLVTSLCAVTMQRAGHGVGILDADITGPSIPKSFGITGRAFGTEGNIEPRKTDTGIDIISINFFLENETDPVVWRGPVIANMVKQFWSDVIWQDDDYLFVDMPPGTGDVPLTVFQSLPVDGILIVTSPQELVSMVVTKAVKMAEMMNIPILGIIENYSYFRCPDNGKDYEIFGKSHIEQIAYEHGLPLLARLPIDPKLAEACDEGVIEDADLSELELGALMGVLEGMLAE